MDQLVSVTDLEQFFPDWIAVFDESDLLENYQVGKWKKPDFESGRCRGRLKKIADLGIRNDSDFGLEMRNDFRELVHFYSRIDLMIEEGLEREGLEGDHASCSNIGN